MGVWGSRGHPKPREKRRRIRSITRCSEVHTYMRQRQWKEKNNNDPQKQQQQH